MAAYLTMVSAKVPYVLMSYVGLDEGGAGCAEAGATGGCSGDIEVLWFRAARFRVRLLESRLSHHFTAGLDRAPCSIV